MNKFAFILDGLRTPFGSFGSTLAKFSAPELAAPLLKELCQRNQLETVDEVILGQVLQAGTGQAPARQALLKAGLPSATSALTINKVCGSGLKAVMLAADRIRLGDTQIALAGGMESMSQAPYAMRQARFAKPFGNQEVTDLLLWDSLTDPYSNLHMGVLTEERCSERQLSRQRQDEYATHSYQRALAAQERGIFAEEIFPMDVKGQRMAMDEEPSKVDFHKIPTLKPAFTKEGTITAANASTLNDGAAALLVCSESALGKRRPLAKIIAYSEASIAPSHFSLAPIQAMKACAQKAGIPLDQFDLYEINEAFSAVPLMAMDELSLHPAKVNVNGGAVSLGHPLGASGARVLLHLALELRRRKARFGMASLCIGGGEAVAMAIEVQE